MKRWLPAIIMVVSALVFLAGLFYNYFEKPTRDFNFLPAELIMFGFLGMVGGAVSYLISRNAKK